MENVQVYPDPQTVAQAAAERVVRAAEVALATGDRFTIALSGGSTPRALYALLAEEPFIRAIDWTKVIVFWGDERCVPPDHPDSNAHLARAALLDFVPIPMANIHRIHGEMEPEQAAAAYETRLREFFAARLHDDRLRARFDLVLLGMGDDGHTASLFPGTAALGETTRWVVASYVEKLGAWRITLTPAALNAAAEALFLVTGAGKAPALRAVLAGPRQPERYPAQLIAPEDGQMTWLVDAAAASLLPTL